MKLLVIVLCLLSERFLVHGISYQRFAWFRNYSATVFGKLADTKYINNPWMALAIVVLPLVIAVSLVYLTLQQVLFGFVGLILNVLIFLYCLGPQNIFYPLSETDSEYTGNERVSQYFSSVNSQLFAPVFWYLVGGPIGVLAYRVITLCRTVEPIANEANQLANVLEWIPARLTALLILLVGNFQSGFSRFTQYLLAKPEDNNAMISECGLQAAKTQESEEEIPMTYAERLVEHATIVLLVVVALLILSTSA